MKVMNFVSSEWRKHQAIWFGNLALCVCGADTLCCIWQIDGRFFVQFQYMSLIH